MIKREISSALCYEDVDQALKRWWYEIKYGNLCSGDKQKLHESQVSSSFFWFLVEIACFCLFHIEIYFDANEGWLIKVGLNLFALIILIDTSIITLWFWFIYYRSVTVLVNNPWPWHDLNIACRASKQYFFCDPNID